MSKSVKPISRLWIAFSGTACAALIVSAYSYFGRTAAHAEHEQSHADTLPSVLVSRPLPGGVEHVSVQPGTIHAWEYQDIFANVSGYLVKQNVDIGDRVKKGQLLAEIDAPELLKEAELAAAQVNHAEAKVKQARAHVDAAKAELHATRQLITQRQAEKLSAESFFDFRTKQHSRIRELARSNSVDQRLVDEEFEKLESARSAKDAAEAAVRTAEADAQSKEAHVLEVEADLKAYDANLSVSQASLAKAEVYVDFTKIRSYYDGIISRRNFHNGDYVRTAQQGTTLPLLTVQRTDLMRVIVQVPDTDVAETQPGDPVNMRIVTLPTMVFKDLRVSRIANSQDDRSRTMRIEVDVPNPDGIIRHGMYAEVTIATSPASSKAFRVPSSCVRYEEGVPPSLQVIRGAKVVRQTVTVGQDDGDVAEIVAGLQPDDLVVHEGIVPDGATLRPSQIHLMNRRPPARTGQHG